jgi:hypothetical protein
VIAAALLALSLTAGPAPAPEPTPPPFAQEEWDVPDDEDERRPRLLLSAWGGQALDAGGAGRSSGLLGGEVAWAFSALDVGVAAYGYRSLVEATREWSPVVMLRLTERFRTRRGVEAAFSFGLGAGRPDDWIAWFQVALGARVHFGRLFLGGEIAFEQNDLLRLAGGLGVAF